MGGERNVLLTSPSESYHSPRSLSSHQNPMIQMVYLPCLNYPTSAPLASLLCTVPLLHQPHHDILPSMLGPLLAHNLSQLHYQSLLQPHVPKGKSLIICLLLVTRKREVSKI